MLWCLFFAVPTIENASRKSSFSSSSSSNDGGAADTFPVRFDKGGTRAVLLKAAICGIDVIPPMVIIDSWITVY